MPFEGAEASTGGLSPDSVQKGGKRSAWIAHIKSVAKAKGIKFGEAMKIASKSFKGGGGCGGDAPMAGGSGPMEAKMGPMGGRRRRGTKKNRKGGSLYGFGAGSGNGASDGSLVDGAGRYGDLPDATWSPPGGSSLTGADPSAPASGGRRSRRHRRRRGSSRTAKVGGKRRR